MSFRALLIGDLHLSDRPPASCTESYLDDLFDLLDQTVQLASTDVDAVVFAGDVFHHKQPSRTSHGLVQRFIDLVYSYPTPVFFVPGNHDQLHGRLDSVVETQPLGTVVRTAGTLLCGPAEDMPLFGIPWFADWTDPVPTHLFRQWGQADKRLLITHAPLFPVGMELPGELVDRTEWASRMDNRGFCFYGHIHDAHGIWEHGGVSFCNHGALTRGAFQETDIRRKLKVTLWDEDNGFVPVDLKYRPATEVFRFAEKMAEAEHIGLVNGFVDAVDRVDLDVASVQSVLEHVRRFDVDERVVSLVNELLLEVG